MAHTPYAGQNRDVRPLYKVRECPPDEAAIVSPVALLLGEAFAADPWMEYVFQGPPRPELVARLLEPMVRLGLARGRLFVTDPALSGVAVGLPPGTTDLLEADLDGDSGADIAAHIGAESFTRYVRYDTATRVTHKHAVQGGHWYVILVGVAPGQQRQGIGSALMAPLLALADADGLPTYLETSSEPNVPFYQRLGFGVAGHGAGPGETSPYWAMVRQPPGRDAG